MSDYDTDFALWAERQAGALRRRANNEIDWGNVAEEIDSLSRSDKCEIRNWLAVICEHLQVAIRTRRAFEQLAQLHRQGARQDHRPD